MPAPSIDPEAIADPIRGSLELSRAVRERLPLLLATILLAAIFIGGWLVLLVGGVTAYGAELVSTGRPAALASLFLVSLPLWLSVLAVGLLLRGAIFFRGFGAGHIAVDRAGEAEPDGIDRAPRDLTRVPNPARAIFSLARAPSARAGETARLLGILSFLFVPLLVLLSADAMLIAGGSTLLWKSVPEGGAAADAILLLIGLAALLASASSAPLLSWVARRLGAINEVEKGVQARVPHGMSPLERYSRHLATDARYHPILDEVLKAGKPNVPLRGASGKNHSFDLCLQLPGGSAFGRERSFYLRVFKRAPKMEDVVDLEIAVADVADATGVPPARVVMLNSPGTEGAFIDNVDDEVFERLMERHITGRAGWKRYACAIELVTEQPDGTYDFVPFKVTGG